MGCLQRDTAAPPKVHASGIPTPIREGAHQRSNVAETGVVIDSVQNNHNRIMDWALQDMLLRIFRRYGATADLQWYFPIYGESCTILGTSNDFSKAQVLPFRRTTQ
mmetsp:Transcript_37137/g.57600  ORF Transcript_37137/g.57600 Transcript_37137/m.57600 type:complete len:106 (-) Transcript_37137:624-941(-)